MQALDDGCEHPSYGTILFSNVPKTAPTESRIMMFVVSAIGVLLALFTMFLFFVGIAIGMSYHPDLATQYWFTLAGAGVVTIAVITLLVKHSFAPPPHRFTSLTTAILGSIFMIGGFGLMVTDMGDALAYLAPAVLGLCMLIVSVASLKKGEK